MMSQQEHDELLKRIKVETTDEYFEYGTNNNQAQTSRTEQQTQIEELFNSALVENLDTNEKVKQDIERFMESQREKINRNNLITYCGILESDLESDGCARSNSIYVPKFGNTHIKKTKIINPYGAISQMYHNEMLNMQKKKLVEFSNSYVKPINMNELKRGNPSSSPGGAVLTKKPK